MGTLNATDRPEGVGSGFVGPHRCPRLIGEISDVLDRPRLHKQIGAECACEFVEMISALPNQVTDLSEIAVARRDVDDDYLVVSAREHDAAWIVTGDDDLLGWDEQQPPTIAPAAFEKWLSKGRELRWD